MHVNNETGVATDVDAIARIVAEHGALFHVDAAQSASHISIDTSNMPVSLLSVSGHKIYGQKALAYSTLGETSVSLSNLRFMAEHTKMGFVQEPSPLTKLPGWVRQPKSPRKGWKRTGSTSTK